MLVRLGASLVSAALISSGHTTFNGELEEAMRRTQALIEIKDDNASTGEVHDAATAVPKLQGA